jgi:serine/threonine-protein kinase
MGEVYEAQHRSIGRRVAIKLLLPEFAARADVLSRFEVEARASGRLAHENVAAVYDVGIAPDGGRYLVMEYLDGEDCASHLKRVGALGPSEAKHILVQACRGMEAAHAAGIIHRDLKPANLFLCRHADSGVLVKVLDFGIAKLRSALEPPAAMLATDLTGTGAVGTPHYMAPEQVRGASAIDQRADVYALGVVLFELLSAHRPHQGSSAFEIANHVLHGTPRSLSTLRAGLPRALCEIVERAMARSPADRFASVQALREALSRPLDGPQSEANDVGTLDSTRASATETQPSPPTIPTGVGHTLPPPAKRRVRAWRSPRFGLRASALVLATTAAALALRWGLEREPAPQPGVAAAPAQEQTSALREPAERQAPESQSQAATVAVPTRLDLGPPNVDPALSEHPAQRPDAPALPRAKRTLVREAPSESVDDNTRGAPKETFGEATSSSSRPSVQSVKANEVPANPGASGEARARDESPSTRSATSEVVPTEAPAARSGVLRIDPQNPYR